MSGNLLPLISQRFLNRPLLVHPQTASDFLALLGSRVDLAGAFAEPMPAAPNASRFVGTYDKGDGQGRRRFTRAEGKTAIITIDGSLVNRGPWVGTDMCTGMVSYEGIGAQLDEVAAEARKGSIENLVLDVNSFGGEATGMAALARKVRGLRKSLHVVAVVNDVSASACYGIISGADYVVVSETSMVGSIGVVMMHLDRSAELSAKGIRPTLIHAGAKKVDGNSFGPLPDSVRADMQKDVLAFYDQFLGTVEAGRGKARLSVKKARETEADTFIGQEAIDAGLADRMGSLEEVLAELSRPVRASGKTQTKGTKMERDDISPTSQGASQIAMDAARIEGEKAGSIVGMAAGKKEGQAEGAKAERDRIGAIMGLPEAEKRQSTALKLALDPVGFSAETVKGVLAGLPEDASAAGATAAKTEPKTTPISQRADAPEIGASTPQPAAPEAARSGWAKAAAKINASAVA